MFDKLRELSVNPDAESSNDDEEDSELPQGETGTWESKGAWDKESEDTSATWEKQEYVQDKTGWVPIEQVERESMELIPAFDHEFWSEFGNTLRVFGTEEGVWSIANWPTDAGK
jgi:poly(A)-specific ribonuclease